MSCFYDGPIVILVSMLTITVFLLAKNTTCYVSFMLQTPYFCHDTVILIHKKEKLFLIGCKMKVDHLINNKNLVGIK